MQETLIRIKEGTFPKKYTAVIRNKRTGRIRMQPFGDQRYQHYKDRTRLGKYTTKNHGSRKRMRNYYSRHSGVRTRKAGIAKEKKRAKRLGRYTAKLLSHTYLW